MLVVLVGCTHENTKLVADRTTTTTVPTTTTALGFGPLPEGVSPLEHNSTAAGVGGLGARRTVAQEDLRVSLVLERRDGTAGESVRAAVEVTGGSWAVTGVRFDFGDGGSSAPATGGGCPQGRNEVVFDAEPHAYAKAGDYRVSVSVTAAPCPGGEPVTLTTSLTYHRR